MTTKKPTTEQPAAPQPPNFAAIGEQAAPEASRPRNRDTSTV